VCLGVKLLFEGGEVGLLMEVKPGLRHDNMAVSQRPWVEDRFGSQQLLTYNFVPAHISLIGDIFLLTEVFGGQAQH